MELKNFYAQDANGNILPGAACSLYLPGTTTLVTGLQDAAGKALANPFNADTTGLIAFAAPNGTYDLYTVMGTKTGAIRVQFIDVDKVSADAASAAASAKASQDAFTSGTSLIVVEAKARADGDAAIKAALAKDDGSYSVGFRSLGVGRRLEQTYSIQDFAAAPGAAALLADAQSVLAKAPSRSIINWPAMDYALDQSALDAGGKAFLHMLNGTTFGGGYDTALPGQSFGMVDKGLRLRRLRGASSTDYADFLIQREANYSGGTAGYVNSTVRVETNVRAGATAFEWGATFVLNNYAVGAGENTPFYAQGNKRADGSTWAGVLEFRDYTIDPATASVACEIDMFGNGTDAARNRVLMDWVIGLRDSTGVAPDVGYGLRIGPQNGLSSNMGTLWHALHLSGKIDTAFYSEGTGNILIKDKGTRNIGIDLIDAIYSGPAIRLPTNAMMTLDSTGSVFMRYNGTTTRTEIGVGSAAKFGFSNDGKMYDSNGDQILSNRQKGWSAATGTASRATFNTSNVTLEQLAQRVKAIVDDGMTIGFWGN